MRIATTTSASNWSITDPWGRISFYNADVTNLGPKIHAAIDVVTSGAGGANSHIDFKADQGQGAGLETKMRIRNDGLVGIGTTSPNESLEVAGNIHVSGADRSIFNRSNNALTFGTNNTEHARLTSTGALLVGVSAAPNDAGSGAVVAQDRVIINSDTSTAGSGRCQIIAGVISSVTATTGTAVFKFKSNFTSPRAAYVKLSVNQRANSSTPSNSPSAEYAFQLHATSGGVCSQNGLTTIFQYTYSTSPAFADLGNYECTVTLTNPVAVALLGAYKVEILTNAGAWTLDSVTVT
jgi:hypothetical protein